MKKGVLSFIAAFLMLFLSVSFAYSNEITDDYLTIAQNYISANDYSKALDYLNQIIEIEPGNVKAIELKNKIAPVSDVPSKTETQQTSQVLNSVQNPQNVVILNAPSADVEKFDYNSDYYNKKGQEYYKNCDYNTAIEYFFKSIGIDKNNSQAYNNLGMAYFQKKNTPLAIKYLKKAHSLNKEYSQPLVNIAMIYKQLGNEKKELYYLKKAIKYNSNDYEAYFLLAEFYRSKSLYIKSIYNYKQAIEISNDYADAYFGLGFAYFETEDFNYAAAALTRYLELKPNSDYGYYMLAKTFLILGKYDFAKPAIEKAISINPSNDYEYELARIDYYLENYAEALNTLEALMVSSNSSEYFNYAGLCNYKMKNIDAAIANFNKAIELDSLRPIYYYNLAQCYKSIGDKKNYVKNVNTATKITPINYQDFIDLSYIYYDNGNPGFAVNSLNNAIKKYPSIKALYLSKLKIFEALGDNLNYNETKDEINERFNTNDNDKKIFQK